MKVNRAADYAVRIMVCLARHHDTPRVTRQEIVEQTGVPAAFLKRIIQKLVQSELVSARPGLRGGCSLAQPAGRISVLKIIETIDGPIEISKCLSHGTACPCSENCGFRRLLHQLQREATGLLDNTAVADLAGYDARVLCLPPVLRCS
jgi:Rrf2 family protein